MFAGFLDFARKDVDLPGKAPTRFLRDLHATFIEGYQRRKDGYEYVMSEYLRMSGIFWCCSAADMLGELARVDGTGIVDYVKQCWRPEVGGFSPAHGHSPHLLHTLSAVQLLLIYGHQNEADVEAIARFVRGLQNEDGSFRGDTKSTEVDTRFSFCALATLHLIGKTDAVDLDKATAWLLRCYNPDGGFGTRPGSESHAGQVFCCVSYLALAGELEAIDCEKTAEWLAQRQCPSGGLNGRPEKLPDVCYSWWVLASLSTLKKLDWIDRKAMRRFIYACQDDETGGFADRPGDVADPFHTVFGIAALRLLDAVDPEDGQLLEVDPIFAMTRRALGALSIFD